MVFIVAMAVVVLPVSYFAAVVKFSLWVVDRFALGFASYMILTVTLLALPAAAFLEVMS